MKKVDKKILKEIKKSENAWKMSDKLFTAGLITSGLMLIGGGAVAVTESFVHKYSDPRISICKQYGYYEFLDNYREEEKLKVEEAFKRGEIASVEKFIEEYEEASKAEYSRDKFIENQVKPIDPDAYLSIKAYDEEKLYKIFIPAGVMVSSIPVFIATILATNLASDSKENKKNKQENDLIDDAI